MGTKPTYETLPAAPVDEEFTPGVSEGLPDEVLSLAHLWEMVEADNARLEFTSTPEQISQLKKSREQKVDQLARLIHERSKDGMIKGSEGEPNWHKVEGYKLGVLREFITGGVVVDGVKFDIGIGPVSKGGQIYGSPPTEIETSIWIRGKRPSSGEGLPSIDATLENGGITMRSQSRSPSGGMEFGEIKGVVTYEVLEEVKNILGIEEIK
jgi:hypothetical protein